MAESRKLFTIKSDASGEIKTSEEVVAIIAGLAATEVEGVTSIGGGITNDLVSKSGMKNLSKGIEIEVFEGEVKVEVTVHLGYGYNIPEICTKIQERVKNAVESMTGLTVSIVDISVASVQMEENE